MSADLVNASIHEPLLKQSVRLAVPIASAYLVIVAGLLVEYRVVGKTVGPEGIAALGLAGTLALVLVLSFHALEIAVQAITSRRYGEGSMRATGEALDQSLLISFGLGIPLTIVLYFVAPWLFASASAPVGELSTSYFRWRLPGLPILIAVLSMIGFFNGIGRPTIPALLYAGIIGANAVLCVGLVEGRWGLPKMGIAGAGLAQTIAALMGLLGFGAVLALPTYRRTFAVFQSWRLNKALSGQLLLLSGPVFLQQFLANFGMYVFALINARVHDGGLSLAASTLARQVGYISYLPSLGFGLAAATLVGQQLGAGEHQRARRAGLICWGLGAAFMGGVGLLFMVAGDWLATFFIDKQTNAGLNPDDMRKLAGTLLLIIGAMQIFESANTILGKALQGAGDTRLVMWVSAGFQWGLFLPLAWFLAITLEMGGIGAMLALLIQTIGAGTVMLFIFMRGKWMHGTL